MAIYFDSALEFVAPEIARQAGRQLINAAVSPIDQFFAVLDFKGTKSPYVTNEIDTLTGTTAVNNADVATDDSVTTFINPNRVHDLTLLVGDTTVGDFTHYALSADQPQTELQRALQTIHANPGQGPKSSPARILGGDLMSRLGVFPSRTLLAKGLLPPHPREGMRNWAPDELKAWLDLLQHLNDLASFGRPGHLDQPAAEDKERLKARAAEIAKKTDTKMLFGLYYYYFWLLRSGDPSRADMEKVEQALSNLFWIIQAKEDMGVAMAALRYSQRATMDELEDGFRWYIDLSEAMKLRR